MCKMSHFGNCDPETEDQEYCIFHKPNKDEKEAVEFYRKFLERFKPRIEEIEVYGKKIKRFVFEESVDARGFVFPEIPKEPIEYKGWKSIFSFEWAVFKKKALFSYTDFKKAYIKSELRLTTKELLFSENSDIKEASFESAIELPVISSENFLSFEHAQFKELADFERAEFDLARFMGAQFSHAIFENATFQHADFLWSRFNLANFNWTIFEHEAIFEDAQFKIGQFMESKFNKGNFTRAQFEKAYFSDETIAYPGTLFTIYEGWTEFKKGDFKGARFREIYFEKVRVLEHLSFEGAVITERALFIDSREDISSLLDENCLKNKCWRTSNIHNSFEVCEKRFCHPQPLSEVAKLQRIMYKRLGDRENADKMFVLEMRAKRMLRMLRAKENFTNVKGFKNKLKATISYIGTWIGVQTERVLADWITEYGTNWRRILTSSGAVIGIMGFIYWILSRFSGKTFLGIPLGTIYTCEHCATGEISGFLNALYYSLVTFTTLGYGDMHPTGWLKALSAIEALTGAVFMALIVAVIARKWMR